MSSRPHLLEALQDRVLLCDGGMGSRVQALTLDVERDYWGKENCTEVLNLSRPELVREIHRGYYEAGSDMVLTNSFGGSPITLGEFDLQERAYEINKLSVELAREAADSFSDGRHRWVIGDIGPGTKLPSLGNITYDALEAALTVQCRGLIAGGADAILTETNQDTLFIKAAVNAAKIARAESGSTIPIFCQVTVETTGTLLVGPDMRSLRRCGRACAGRAADGPQLRHRAAGKDGPSMYDGCHATGLACSASSPMRVCRNWSMARPTIRSRLPSWPPGWSASSSRMVST